MKLTNQITVLIIFVLLLATAVFFQACKSTNNVAKKDSTLAVSKISNVKHAEWLSNSVIYEINTRQYTVEGTFNSFAKHLPRLKEMGIDILWFMPVHPIGVKNRKGGLGSYYSVQDYKGINPEYGNIADFKNLVAEAHKLGLKVIIDWVANHTAWDCKWITEHPDWYAKDKAGKIIAPFDWTDVAKLDYKNTDMRKAMIESLKFWLTEANIDGFRCDVASEVPTDFWDQARKELETVKPIMMLAEAEKNDLLVDAFDLDYGWEMMHLMNQIANGEKNAKALDVYFAKLDSILPKNAFKMYFTTNHDENSWNGTEYERYKEGAQAFAVFTATIPGVPMIYSGQEAGMKKRLAFFTKDTVNFSKLPLESFYKTLTKLRKSNPALLCGAEGGSFECIKTSADDAIYSFKRQKGEKLVVVILNLSAKEQSFTFSQPLPTGEFVNVFTSAKSEISKIKDLKLKAWEYLVYEK